MLKTLLAALLVIACASAASARPLHQVHPSGVVKMHAAHGHMRGAHKPA
jgi:hypothetical protein